MFPHPAFEPVQRFDQRPSQRGELIIHPGRHRGVSGAGDEGGALQTAQRLREHLLRNPAESSHQFGRASAAGQEAAHHRNGPLSGQKIKDPLGAVLFAGHAAGRRGRRQDFPAVEVTRRGGLQRGKTRVIGPDLYQNPTWGQETSRSFASQRTGWLPAGRAPRKIACHVRAARHSNAVVRTAFRVHAHFWEALRRTVETGCGSAW